MARADRLCALHRLSVPRRRVVPLRGRPGDAGQLHDRARALGAVATQARTRHAAASRARGHRLGHPRRQRRATKRVRKRHSNTGLTRSRRARSNARCESARALRSKPRRRTRFPSTHGRCRCRARKGCRSRACQVHWHRTAFRMSRSTAPPSASPSQRRACAASPPARPIWATSSSIPAREWFFW